MIFLRQDIVIEHDHIFVCVFLISLFKLNTGKWFDAGIRGVSTIDVQNKNLFKRGGRAVQQDRGRPLKG